MRYVKDSARLLVRYVDSDTDEVVFEVKDRNWMNVGELLSDVYVAKVMEANLGDDGAPRNLMVIVVGDYTRIE